MARQKPFHAMSNEERMEQRATRVAAEISLHGQKEYDSTYKDAVSRLKRGDSAQRIRMTLERTPLLLDERPEGEPIEHRSIHNAVERKLFDIRHRAIDDAIEGRPQIKVR